MDGHGLSCEFIVIVKVRGPNHLLSLSHHILISILIGENEVQDFHMNIYPVGNLPPMILFFYPICGAIPSLRCRALSC